MASLLAGCGVPVEPTASVQSQAIIGGVADPGDPAVVMVVSHDANTTDECTGTVISPTAILTAAHCLDPATHPNYTFGIFVGADGTKLVLGQLLPVSGTYIHPGYNAANSDNDVGIVTLVAPLGITPLPVNRAPLDLNVIGASARIIGYGRNDYAQPGSAGPRRQATTTVASIGQQTLVVGDNTNRTCLGDSGAPALVMIGGVETIVGEDSHGLFGCTAPSTFMRTDAYLSFLAPYLPAIPDMSVLPDLSTPPDLEQSPDLFVSPDLAAVPDLGTPAATPDLASPGSSPDLGGVKISKGCSVGPSAGSGGGPSGQQSGLLLLALLGSPLLWVRARRRRG
jgi:hypothetical protein